MKNNSTKLQIPIIIVLGLFTFGISDLFWVYTISERVNIRRYPPVKQLTLFIITLGIYGIFWTYLMINELEKQTGRKITRKKIVCTVISALFLRNISVAVINDTVSEACAVAPNGGYVNDSDRM